MLAKACACAVVGLEGALIEVEVDIGQGLSAFCIVGLPDAAVNEAKERVRAAIKNSGGIFPMRRITDNLAPADLCKKGPSYDLPIAVAILMSSEQFPAMTATGEVVGAESALFLGELSLDGSLRHTQGILPMVALAAILAGLALAFQAMLVHHDQIPVIALCAARHGEYPAPILRRPLPSDRRRCLRSCHLRYSCLLCFIRSPSLLYGTSVVLYYVFVRNH